MRKISKQHLLLLGIGFGLVGALLLLRSFAATGSQRVEAENGSRAGSTAVCDDTNASADKYLKLAQSCTPGATPTPGGGGNFSVYLGYADGNQMGRPQLPSPWKGDSGVIFHGKSGTECCVAEGTTPGWDGGTIRVQNNSGSTMSVKVKITEMDYCDRDWPLVSLPAGGNAIFVGDVGADVGGQGNPAVFDTSDVDWSCHNTAYTNNCEAGEPGGSGGPIIGRVTVTINGVDHSYLDETRILTARASANGVDSTCQKNKAPEGIEYTPWTKVI